jgi:hypothetical protein
VPRRSEPADGASLALWGRLRRHQEATIGTGAFCSSCSTAIGNSCTFTTNSRGRLPCSLSGSIRAEKRREPKRVEWVSCNNCFNQAPAKCEPIDLLLELCATRTDAPPGGDSSAKRVNGIDAQETARPPKAAR